MNPSLWWGYDFFACKINSVAININTGNETMKKIPEFKDLYTRLFTIEDISEVTQLPPSTLRTWATRGIVSLSTSYNPGKNAGRGEKSLYSVYDALQFIFLGRMSRDAQPVKVISECCFSEILDITLERLSEIAVGIYHGANYDPVERTNSYERYAFIYERGGNLVMTQEWREWAKNGVYSFHTIDVIVMAAAVFSLYARKKGLVV